MAQEAHRFLYDRQGTLFALAPPGAPSRTCLLKLATGAIDAAGLEFDLRFGPAFKDRTRRRRL